MHRPRFPSERQLVPFKTYIEEQDGKEKEYHIPLDKFDSIMNLINASKSAAINFYNRSLLDPDDKENYEEFLTYTKRLDMYRGQFVKEISQDLSVPIRCHAWDDVSLNDPTDEIMFEIFVSDPNKPNMDPVHPEPIRFVVPARNKRFFQNNLQNGKGLIMSFLNYVKPQTESLLPDSYNTSCVTILNDMIYRFGHDEYNPEVVRTGPGLDARFYQFNDASVSDTKRTITFRAEVGFFKYSGTFSHNAPRFAATEGYMHTGVLEQANHVIKDAFKDVAFSYELRVDVSSTVMQKNFSISWTAYRYNKMKTDMYQIVYHAADFKKFEDTNIQQIIREPVSQFLTRMVSMYSIDSRIARRFQEIDCLKQHAIIRQQMRLIQSTEYPVYYYNFKFWTFIASFVPFDVGTNTDYNIVITLINKLSDSVNEAKERLIDERILAERERVDQFYQVNTIVTGQNRLLRDLIRDVNRRIGELPIKTSDLPQGDPRKWLIFGTSKTNEMRLDETLEIQDLTPDNRQAMERKSNLIKAQILNRYFQDAIDEDRDQAQSKGKTPNVFDFLYHTEEMQNLLALGRYDKFEKICPGVFALIIRAFPRGYKTGKSKNNITAVEYWHECIHAMLVEFNIHPNIIRTKTGDSFAPEVQFYIDCVLAHQNKKRRRPIPPVDTGRAVMYDTRYQFNRGLNPPSLFRVDGPGRRTNGLLQARVEEPEDKETKQSLQNEIDSLRRSVNQLALMPA